MGPDRIRDREGRPGVIPCDLFRTVRKKCRRLADSRDVDLHALFDVPVLSLAHARTVAPRKVAGHDPPKALSARRLLPKAFRVFGTDFSDFLHSDPPPP